MPAGAPERQRGVLLVLDLEKRVQHHGSAAARKPAVSPALPLWCTLLRAQAARSLMRAAAPVQVDVVCLVCRLLTEVRVPPARPPAASYHGAALVLLPSVCALARARLYIANSRISGVLVAFLAAAASGAVACCSAVVVVMRAAVGASRGSRRAPLRTCPNMTAWSPQHLHFLLSASRSWMYASSARARSSLLATPRQGFTF